MHTFHYTVVNQDKKELSGTIEAPDEITARKRLNELGFAVMSLAVLDDATVVPATPETGSSGNSLNFEGIDRNNKKVRGTITAESPLAGFRRLMDEFHLTITSLGDEDLASLQGAYEDLKKKNKHGAEPSSTGSATGSDRQELALTVNDTVQKIQLFLEKYGALLKTDEKNKIKSYIDQLARIKDSTNVEHVRATCSKMLTYIQEHEIFEKEEDTVRERTDITVETKELLHDLEQHGLKKEIDINEILIQWKDRPFLGGIAHFILSLTFADHPDVQKLRKELKTVKGHLWSYVKIWLHPKNSAFRQEAVEHIQSLLRERSKIREQLNDMIYTLKHANGSAYTFLEKIVILSGWLLAFYVIYYSASFVLTMKAWNIQNLPKSLAVYHSPLFSATIIFFFIAHSTAQIKQLFFPNSFTATLALIPTAIIG
ncbi:MAG: hypothetical protein UY05_C0009G0008 [Candidatus Peregrinibacteria bacterium GW2011_GWA2_47_7]|nr:MAG: hypothetical protein UY05_C0009G0008 [Candidatus Peregrinibacteria bacterium GW2011_GWA2_47_7]